MHCARGDPPLFFRTSCVLKRVCIRDHESKHCLTADCGTLEISFQRCDEDRASEPRVLCVGLVLALADYLRVRHDPAVAVDVRAVAVDGLLELGLLLEDLVGWP